MLDFRLKLGMVYATALNSVLQNRCVDHAVLQTHALIAAIIFQLEYKSSGICCVHSEFEAIGDFQRTASVVEHIK